MPPSSAMPVKLEPRLTPSELMSDVTPLGTAHRASAADLPLLVIPCWTLQLLAADSACANVDTYEIRNFGFEESKTNCATWRSCVAGGGEAANCVQQISDSIRAHSHPLPSRAGRP